MQITFKFNGETVTKRTENVEEAILAVRPEQLHTEMYVTIKNGKQLIERQLALIPARKVFNDDFHRQVFIQNLLIQ